MGLLHRQAAQESWLMIACLGPEAVSSISQLPACNNVGAFRRLPHKAKQQHMNLELDIVLVRVTACDSRCRRAEFTGEYVVDATGVFSMPYVQSVPVAGLNTGQIEKLITKLARRLFA